MGVTYTPAVVRDLRQRARSARRIGDEHLALALTSLVAVLAVGLAVGGRLAARPRAAAARPGAALVNLNTVNEARELEAVFEGRFANPADRQFAAAELFQFIRSIRKTGDTVPNTGTVLGAVATAEAIERTPALAEYAQRLQGARERAARTRAPAPNAVPLLSSEDLTVIKPSLIVRTPGEFGRTVVLWGILYLVAFWAVALCWWMRGFRGDGALLTAAHLLTAVGLAILVSRPDPLRDTLLFVRYVQGVCIGLAAFCAASFLNIRRAAFLTLSYVPLVAALALSAVLLLFGTGPVGSGAKVNLGPVQPMEAIRLLLALFLAGYFARRWEVLRQVRGRQIRDLRIPGWLNLPRVEYLLPLVGGVGVSLLFFFLQKDLGPALFLCCVFLATYAVARNRVGMAGLGLIALLGGFYLGYKVNISTTLGARVHMWQSPWDNGVRGGDQIAQAIWAVSTGGFFGTGLGLGDTRYLPAGHTDLVLAAIGEELGFLGLVSVAVVFLLIARRGFGTALRAANDYGFFLATTVTLFLLLPVVVMAAGMLGVVPLTGVVTPFLSYGGSAMVANFAALGILAAVRADSLGADSLGSSVVQPFRAAIRYLGGTLAAAAVALLAVLIDFQIVRGDEYAVKPHLGLQADGVRRYQYNQRVLDLVGLVPRGSVYDRTGLPLATSDDEVARRAQQAYAKLGIQVDSSCTVPVQDRCYPLGGAAFHLLGDARSRLNWTATNTSYAERDLQDRLRGFDDRVTTVVTEDSAGRSVQTVRRDYRDLVPLLRHRNQPNHSAVRTLLSRARDVTLTVDARLQGRLARILAQAAARSARGHAAGVVIDPDTGDLLASASYPFPIETDNGTGHVDQPDTLLDRARYGLYPPGSTFKLVTAAAALREEMGLSRATFMCVRLPDGRVGTRLPGWGIVRDDVLDTAPHGTIGLHDALARSCNAYFAQLAVRVGPQALLETAAMVGVSVSRDNSVARLRATLPYAGYGQGDDLATPLRMARVAAAIASNGELRDVRLETRSSPRTRRQVFLSPAAAGLLRQYLRDAVLSGTARSLSGHAMKIAGKTGTAEVNGAPSHAWFVGFAPFGRAEKRVAFAVVVENAGYGGLAAAPAAGEIVSAAAASGLVR